MTRKEVADSFIHNRWYYKKDKSLNETDEYDLSVEFMHMFRLGFGEIFTPKNIDDDILPFQSINFYCINKDGYLKVFNKNIGYIDDLTVKSLLNIIKELCDEYNLKFVALGSRKYSLHKIEDFLGDSLKYELNKENGKILLWI